MPSLSDLERSAADLEREASEAAAIVAERERELETPLGKARRLAGEAARARKAAAAERTRWTRRTLWLWARLAILALLLWAAWRIGYETGLLAALYP